MHQCLQCAECGHFVTLVGPKIFSGWIACPWCNGLSVCVPETLLTPKMGPLDVEDGFVVIRCQGYEP